MCVSVHVQARHRARRAFKALNCMCLCLCLCLRLYLRDCVDMGLELSVIQSVSESVSVSACVCSRVSPGEQGRTCAEQRRGLQGCKGRGDAVDHSCCEQCGGGVVARALTPYAALHLPSALEVTTHTQVRKFAGFSPVSFTDSGFFHGICKVGKGVRKWIC
jgi:hypothetical protein